MGRYREVGELDFFSAVRTGDMTPAYRVRVRANSYTSPSPNPNPIPTPAPAPTPTPTPAPAPEQADYDKLLERVLVACKAMQEGGWWEPPRVSVKRAISTEFAVAIFKNLVGFA